MLAIQYAIVHKIKGIYLSATIKERLAEKGFSKIILWEGYKAISMTRIDFSAYKYSVWTVDGCDGELYIYTDVVVKWEIITYDWDELSITCFSMSVMKPE